MAGAGDNGGWPADGGSPDDLPDLPEEWGVIVIPDDLSELADEVEAIRAEFHLPGHPSRWQRLLRRRGVRHLRQAATAALRAPVLIISLAVLVTVASLFASTWPGPPRQPATQRTANVTDDRLEQLPALELIDSTGQTVPLLGQLPAVILLTDGCACGSLVADTVAAVPAGITVVTITTTRSSAAGTPPTGATPQAQGKIVKALYDPPGHARHQLKLGQPDGTAAALLVRHDGEIVRTVPRIVSVEVLRPDLARL